MKFLNLTLKGIFMGIANVIPGVSGGTIAVVLRIFDEFIEAINNFYKDFRKYAAFLIPIILGSVIGIVIFSKFTAYSLENYSFPTNLFFTGLIMGSIPFIYKKAVENKPKLYYYLVAFIACMVVVVFSFIKNNGNIDGGTSVSDITLSIPFLINIFIGGVLSSAAMVIPGISGSFVMVLLGLYNISITSVNGLMNNIGNAIVSLTNGTSFFEAVWLVISSKECIILCTSGVGIILGVLFISRIIELLLKKAFTLTYFIILGLVFGSIFSILYDPLTYQTYGGFANIDLYSVLGGIITMILGFFIAMFLGKE